MDWKSCVDNSTGYQVATLKCIPVLFSQLVNSALILAGTVALIFIIWSGIRYITSGGDPKRVEGARKTLTYSIIGLIIIFLSFVIINWVAIFTGVHCLTQFGFSNCQTKSNP